MAYCFVERHVNVPGAMWCECGSLVAGTLIDGYNLISYIGHGTSSDVYLAEQPLLNNRKVVIKIARRSWHQSDIDNFQREAALLASLSHPYILPIYAYGVIYERQSPLFTSSPYLVLSYAEQGSLEEAFMQAGKCPWPLMRIVSMALEIADALDYAHSRGVLHRDVKPANLLQMGSHVLLSDFSVASLIDAEVSHLKAPWAGSPAYMAPEVWRHSPGRYSDQYALAVTCFRLLTSDYPWAKMAEGNVQGWMHLHRSVPPRPLQEFRPDLPQAVDLVLQRGMAKDPHERYPTVLAFARDLLDASEDRTQALDRPADLSEPITEGIRENVGPSAEQPRPGDLRGAQRVSVPSRSGEESDVPASARHYSRWRWYALVLVLNALISVLLAVEAYWQPKEIMSAINLLLALWPSLPVGLLLARWFRRIRLTTLSWAIFWGVFFGMTDVLLSGLVCYFWVALAQTIPHWGHDWQQSGDGMRIFGKQVVALTQFVWEPLLFGAWLAVLGSALTGVFIYNGQRTTPVPAITQVTWHT